MIRHRFLVAGAGGRMGRAVIREALAAPGVALAGGVEREGADVLGADLGALAGLDPIGVAATATPDFAGVSAVIDFSTPAASLALAEAAAAAGAPLVVGVTGFSADEEAKIAALAEKIPIVKSGNMSLGVNLLAALVREAAARLPSRFDIEIIEAHHREKVDAPSGTARLLGEAAAAGRNADLEASAVHGRVGHTGRRPAGAIGFSVVRGGGIIGDHAVLFAGDEEVIELSHRAIDRALFARGAVAAAEWVAGREAGLYGMDDVLGL